MITFRITPRWWHVMFHYSQYPDRCAWCAVTRSRATRANPGWSLAVINAQARAAFFAQTAVRGPCWWCIRCHTPWAQPYAGCPDCRCGPLAGPFYPPGATP